MVQLHSSLAAPITQHSITTTTKLRPVPNHCFTPTSVPLRRKPSSSSSSSSSNSVFSPTHTFSFTFPSSLSVKCTDADLFVPKPFNTPPRRQPPPPVRASSPKVYVGHSIYKGKAALTVSPRPPEFASLDSGAFKVSREGYIMLQFAPAVGMRSYDWNRKQIFSLSVSEMGTLISLGARKSCEFFHDPFKGKSDEGKVRKVLKVEPLMDGSGHLFNLSVQNKLENIDENMFIPITKAELAVFSSIFNFIMPYLLGWHAFANNIKPEDFSRVNNANPRYGGDYEWNR